MAKISLFGRKRVSELAGSSTEVQESTKDELLALKLKEIQQEAEGSGQFKELPLHLVEPDPNQPRKHFTQIESLAASIHQKGIVQPLIVKPKNDKGRYVIIAGERRYRASVKAGLSTVPCIIRKEDDANVLILQLLENDQRQGVSPLEESSALVKLIDQMKLNKIDVAKQLGHDSAWVSIRLGLQKASSQIKSLVDDKLVEDIRTLHDLRMFEMEDAKKASALIKQIRNNEISGSYRQAISNSRVNARKSKKGNTKKSTVTTIPSIEKLSFDSGQLVVHVGTKKPFRFDIEKGVLEKFKETLSNIT